MDRPEAMRERPSRLAWCHLATLAVAVAMCAWRLDAAATLLLCASGFFLILGRLKSADFDGAIGDALACSAHAVTLDDALRSLARHERRQAMLAELLSDPRVAAHPALMTGCVTVARQLGDAGDAVDHALQVLREDMLRTSR